MEIVNQIQLQSENFPDQKIVKKILTSLPKNFKAKIPIIEESCDLNLLIVTKLISNFTRKSREALLEAKNQLKNTFK